MTSNCVLIRCNLTKVNMMNTTFILGMFFGRVTWSRQRFNVKLKIRNVSAKLNSTVPPNMIYNVNVMIWCSILLNVTTEQITLTRVNEWVSHCCLAPSEQCFSYIMARTSYFSTGWWWCTLCLIFLELAHWSNSPRVDMTLHLDTLSWLPIQLVFTLTP